jgi:hypothetical protein
MKPGWKTTEFYISLAAVTVTALVPLANPGSTFAAVLAALSAALTSAIYGAQRTRIKLRG